MKRAIYLITILLIFSCSNNPITPVKEESYFKNYALAICFSAPFDDPSLEEDTNKAINGYIEKGNLGLEDYEQIRHFVEQWRTTKHYKSK